MDTLDEHHESAKGKRPKKKQCLRLKHASLPESRPCYITSLPFELIAEILLYTSSPKAVLAFARSSKYYCATLLNKSSEYIWRYVRENCKPFPLPAPISIFTESSYAAFVFDGGYCESCNEWTDLSYASYALRIRLCRKETCRSSFRDSKAAFTQRDEDHQDIMGSLPVLESSTALLGCQTHRDPQYWPSVPASLSKCRLSSFRAALEEYVDASSSPVLLEKFLTKCNIQAERVRILMPFCTALAKWKHKYDGELLNVQKKNIAFAENLAKKEGYKYWDLMNSLTFGPIFRTRQKTLESLQQIDYDLCRPNVEAEMLRLKEKRDRQAQEASYKEARLDVEKHYLQLKSAKTYDPLPPLETFREMDIIKMLQSPTKPLNLKVGEELRSSLVTTLLEKNVTEWRAGVKEALSAVLGYPQWNSRELHPVERLSARFLCRRCDRIQSKYRYDGCFDFAGVCAHQCPHEKQRNGKGLRKKWKVWDAEVFVKDEKAVKAMTNLLAACGIDAEDPESRQKLEIIGARIQCLSCSSRIIMDPASVVGHSHRHDNMQITLLEPTEATAILNFPFTAGLSRRLQDREEAMAPVLRQLVSYGCRHCLQYSPEQGEGREWGWYNKRMTFHGVLSHLTSSLHGIQGVIRDEDFFCSEQLDWKEPKKDKKKKKESD